MQTKFCNKCGQEKPISEFGKNKSKKDGLQTQCKACVKLYKQKHYSENKSYYIEKAKAYRQKGRENLNEYKSNLICSICGEDRWWLLDFHHTNPDEKETSIANLIDAPIKLEQELQKCIVVCSNCHRDIHYKMRNK